MNLKSVAPGGGYRPEGLKRFHGEPREEQLLAAGDVLIACTDLTRDRCILGYPAVVPDYIETGATFSLDLVKLSITDPAAMPGFVALALQTDTAHSFMTANSSGTTVTHLKTRAIPNLSITLPSTSEQRRIVTVMSAVDAQIDALEFERAALDRTYGSALSRLWLESDNEEAALRPLAAFMRLRVDRTKVDPDREYLLAGVLNAGKGLISRGGNPRSGDGLRLPEPSLGGPGRNAEADRMGGADSTRSCCVRRIFRKWRVSNFRP